MKKIIFIAAILLVGLSNTQVKAQLRVNIGSQPVWGPTGYDHVDYYYLPDVESYYNVQKRQYMYQNDGKWITSSRLPTKYSNYDLYNGYKVVLNEPKPFLQFQDHKSKYIKYKGSKGEQAFIKNSNDARYYVVKGHPKYAANNKYGNKHDGIIGHQNNGKKNKKYNNNNDDDHEKGNKVKGKENNGHKQKGNKGKGHGKN
jgi:hypothetical protein